MKTICYLSFFLLSILNASCNENKKQAKTEVQDASEIQHEEKGNADDSKHEIDLITIKEKYEYNKSTYYIRLDTLKSRINVYYDSYGDFSLSHCYYIRPDSSIIYKPYIEEERTLVVKNGLIREQKYAGEPRKRLYKYDKNNHLVEIVLQSDHDKNKPYWVRQLDKSVYSKTEVQFKWSGNRLTEIVENIHRGNNISVVSDGEGQNEEIYEYIRVVADQVPFLNVLLQEMGLCGIVPRGDSLTFTEKSLINNREKRISCSFDSLNQLSESRIGRETILHYHRNRENMKKIFNWAKKAEKQPIVFPEPDFKGLDVKF